MALATALIVFVLMVAKVAAARTGTISAAVLTGELIAVGQLLVVTVLVAARGVFADFDRYRLLLIGAIIYVLINLVLGAGLGALGGLLGRMLYKLTIARAR